MDEALPALLRDILERSPEGLAEHALLRELQQADETAFDDGLFSDELALFRAHFLLFHALYRLRDELLVERAGTLHIDVRCIQLGPYSAAAGSAVDSHDPLRDYYLDLSNLSDTSADDLAQMLGAFWVRYYADNRREEALAVLGLEPSADLASAQRRYRELAMRHHPDRGGDAAAFQSIQEAMAVLRRC